MRNWRTAAIATACVGAILVAERPCPALTSTDLTETFFDTTYRSTLRVTGLGRASDATFGNVAFSSDGHFTAMEDDDGTLRSYTGTWRLTNRGRRLRCRMDSEGRAAVRAALVDWIYAEANDGVGPQLTNLRVRLTRVQFNVAKVPATLGAFTLRLNSGGVGTGKIGRRRVSGSITHVVRATLNPDV